MAMLKFIRILLSNAASLDLEIWQMDVKTAFLNGSLDESIYMMQPEGVRFLVCLGMYSISKRCSLVMFSGLRIEDLSCQRKTWPQLMQDAVFKKKCALSVYKGI